MATVLRILPALVMALMVWSALGATAHWVDRGEGSAVQPGFAVETVAV